MVLVSVSKILTFAFRHLVISGVRCSSCLWLELVPPVILLASVSTPENPTLTRVPVSDYLCRQVLHLQAGVQKSGALIHLLSPVVRALPVGRITFDKEGSQGSGSQLCLLAEDEGPKGPCPRSSVASVAHVLSIVDWSLSFPGYKMALSPESQGQSPLWRPTLFSDPKIMGVLGCLWHGESSGDRGTVC